MNSYTLRITPQPLNQAATYPVEFISLNFDDKFEKFMIFKELEPLHLHIYVETKIKISAMRKWIKLKFPKLKGNPYWAIHPCTKCKQKKHKKDMFKTCVPQARTYVAKEGHLVKSKGITSDKLCQYVVKGKELAMTANLTANNSRRLSYIGERYLSEPKKLAAHILKWYETQGQVPPRGMPIRRLIHQIYYQYDDKYRTCYENQLDTLCENIYNDAEYI